MAGFKFLTNVCHDNVPVRLLCCQPGSLSSLEVKEVGAEWQWNRLRPTLKRKPFQRKPTTSWPSGPSKVWENFHGYRKILARSKIDYCRNMSFGSRPEQNYSHCLRLLAGIHCKFFGAPVWTISGVATMAGDQLWLCLETYCGEPSARMESLPWFWCLCCKYIFFIMLIPSHNIIVKYQCL